MTGCSKSSSSKAAADECTGGIASGYVEDAFKATCLREALRRRQGTKLADFFSILPRLADDEYRTCDPMNEAVRHAAEQETCSPSTAVRPHNEEVEFGRTSGDRLSRVAAQHLDGHSGGGPHQRGSRRFDQIFCRVIRGIRPAFEACIAALSNAGR